MPEPIAPALTPEEWADEGNDLFDGLVNIAEGVIDVRLGGPAGARDANRERKALAALLLRGLPGGFTREHVRTLMESPPDESKLTEIAALVASLLTPDAGATETPGAPAGEEGA